VSIEQSLARIPKAFIKTVTVDNDKAFANHQSLARKFDYLSPIQQTLKYRAVALII